MSYFMEIDAIELVGTNLPMRVSLTSHVGESNFPARLAAKFLKLRNETGSQIPIG